MNKPLMYFGMVVIAGAAIISSCQRDPEDSNTTASLDNALAEGEANQVLDAVHNVMGDYNVGKLDGTQDNRTGFLPSCATVTWDTAAQIITIDFGTTGCVCSSPWDGKTRKGQIIFHYTGAYRDSGSVITINTQDYYVNDNKFDLSKTVTNLGLNGNGNLEYDINVSTATFTLANAGGVITWTSQRTREWTEGESTLTPFDDVYLISGSASGTDRNNNPFTVSIIDPLKVDLSCMHITAGSVDITPSGLPVRHVDWGNGTCDDIATVEINGVVYTIHI